jgi:Arc/MetJ-type ribon-helix-helix transcriptional regulator
MVTEVVTARLPVHDTELIKFFIEKGEFKSKSDFFRFAVKHTLADLIQQYLDSMIVMEQIDDNKIDEINKLIKNVREETWNKKYAKSIP